MTPAEVSGVCRGLIDSGITKIEVPVNSPEPLDSIRIATQAFGDAALIGAAIVPGPARVESLHSAGGRLLVPPDCDSRVIGATKPREMQSLPGISTPTEAFAALSTGADGLKLLPGSVARPAGPTALRAVLPPGTQDYAMGGVGPDTFAD